MALFLLLGFSACNKHHLGMDSHATHTSNETTSSDAEEFYLDPKLDIPF